MADRIFFTSDLHFSHDKDFVYKPRGFNSIQEMNETIVQNFWKVMDSDDELYILGDCFLNDNVQGMKLLQQLPGKKFFIWGNHDTPARQQMIKDRGYECLGYSNVVKIDGINFYLSHYPTITSNGDENKPIYRRIINLSGHTHFKSKFYNDLPCVYNVALDAHDNFPVEAQDIINDIKKELERR